MKYRSQQTVYVKTLAAFGSIIGDEDPIIIYGMYFVLLFPEFRVPGTNGLQLLSPHELESQYGE